MVQSLRVQQVGVTLAEVFCVVGTLVGVGVLGTRVQESSGGALAADATLLAPAGPAFSIWSVIYVGLAAYTVWQWIPGPDRSDRARGTRALASASMMLNALWLLVTQQNWLWVSVAVIVALLAVLVLLATAVSRLARPTLVESLVVDTTFGLYLGWVAVATCANVTATLVAEGVRPARTVGAVVAVAVLLVVAVVGVVVAQAFSQWAVAAAMIWGLVWIAVGRLSDAPKSMATATAALAVAVAVALAHAASSRRGRVRSPVAVS